jgi:hypothetical protein
MGCLEPRKVAYLDSPRLTHDGELLLPILSRLASGLSGLSVTRVPVH